MAALASVLVVSIVSLLITRVATVALVTTGMSREAARFQARSALSGVGFTTTEAEDVVGHPVRRRIVMALMLVGSAGIATAVAALAVSFVNADRAEAFTRLGVLAAGLVVLLVVARSRWVDQRLSRVIAHGLERWTDLPARDYANLLHLRDDYVVRELAVCEGSGCRAARSRSCACATRASPCWASSARRATTWARRASTQRSGPATCSCSTAAARTPGRSAGGPPAPRATAPTSAPSSGAGRPQRASTR